MEIRANSNIDSVARVASSPPKASAPISTESEVSFNDSRALETQLSQLPDVRTEKVDGAKHLIGDPTYPPRITIQRIATLLAMNDTDTSNE